MNAYGTLLQQITLVGELLGERSAELTEAIHGLDDDALLRITDAAAAITRGAQRIQAIAAAVVAERSTRETGQAGLAQRHGHRNAADFLQRLTGGSRANAHQQIRVGTAVLEGTLSSPKDPGVDQGIVTPTTVRPWHSPRW